MNMIVTNIDLGSVVYNNPQFRDDTLSFAGAATYKEGTILARQVVNTTVANGVAGGGNTGDGTVTAVSVVGGDVPLVGAYTLTVTAAVTNGGVFSLKDPNDAVIATGLTMTAGAGAATIFEVGGLQFTITDGSTDFAVGDTFTITTVANGKLVPYVVAGAGGAQVPLAVLTYEVTATGAGNQSVRVMISGEVRKERLVIYADGDASNVNNTVIDKLRDYGIVAVDVTELSVLDNQ